MLCANPVHRMIRLAFAEALVSGSGRRRVHHSLPTIPVQRGNRRLQQAPLPELDVMRITKPDVGMT
jgi:hypothetical protein